MSIIERGAITVHQHAVPAGRAYSYVVRCGACSLEVESPRVDMPNKGLALLRGRRATLGASSIADGGDGRPWLIVTGNDANGGNIRPFVRCGDCRGDRDRTPGG